MKKADTLKNIKKRRAMFEEYARSVSRDKKSRGNREKPGALGAPAAQ
ncbi:MAG: hypothetical protein K6T80_07115 [Firmicutes bacterium]|nr:hypothetical protein [Bacillota bacterium]